MQLNHSFTVPVGIEDAWRVLLDIERVAPCMPGAVLETIDGDEFSGSVKVKLGPIALTYKGTAAFVEKDEAAHRATIDAKGRDSRGSSTAGAKVTASLTADGESATRVEVITDLTITGKPAQFGRGVMEEVGNKLIGQFADCLAGKLTAGEPPAASASAAPPSAIDPSAIDPSAIDPSSAAGEGDVRAQLESAGAPDGTDSHVSAVASMSGPVRADRVEPIDLMASAGPAIAKRVAPFVALGLLVVAVVLARRRRCRS
jgi:carbon monoxide dehydrogenase subunit G